MAWSLDSLCFACLLAGDGWCSPPALARALYNLSLDLLHLRSVALGTAGLEPLPSIHFTQSVSGVPARLNGL